MTVRQRCARAHVDGGGIRPPRRSSTSRRSWLPASRDCAVRAARCGTRSASCAAPAFIITKRLAQAPGRVYHPFARTPHWILNSQFPICTNCPLHSAFTDNIHVVCTIARLGRGSGVGGHGGARWLHSFVHFLAWPEFLISSSFDAHFSAHCSGRLAPKMWQQWQLLSARGH